MRFNFGKTIGGRYCVFIISHTVDAVQNAWMEIFSELSKENMNLMIEDLLLSAMQCK